MSHNLDEYRANLMESDTYAVRDDFAKDVQWRRDGAGHVLIEKTSTENVLGSVVGRVLDERLFCGPGGTFYKVKYGNLDGAKFQLLLGRPDNTPFEKDFDIVVRKLKSLQAKINKSGSDNRHLIIEDIDGLRIWFTRNIFKKRVRHLVQTAMLPLI